MLFSSDSMSLKNVAHRLARISLFALAVFCLAATPASAIVYTYENTTAGALPELGSNAACNGATSLVRTFTVPDSFTVSTIALGLNITHPVRGQVRAILNAPDGTNLTFVAQTGGANDDPDDNYDIYLSTLTDGAGTNPLDDADADPVTEPYYHRLVNLAANFYAGNANGTWTLRVCDRFNDANDGTLNRARLVLDSGVAYTPVCSSRTAWDFCPGCADSPPAAATTTAFPGAGLTNGNVTLTLTGTTLTDATASARNFSQVNTQTGGEFGYYVTEFNAAAAQVELVRSETNWAFNVPVWDLQWVQMDQDRNSWEDYIRVRGTNGGTEVRYSISTSAAPSYQINGEILETDTDSTPGDTFGNAFWNFTGAVSAIRSEYWAGDDFGDPNQQFIGYGSGLYCGYDFGDAPTGYGSAGHALGARGVYLGANPPDGEAVTPAAPGSAATVDDSTVASPGVDDEDGVPTFPNSTIVANGSYSVPNIVVHNTSGAAVTLCGWIDFDTNGQAGDGSFESNEGACITVPASGSNAACTGVGTTFTCSITWTVPADYVRNNASSTYARFRVSAGALTTSNFNDVAAGAPSTSFGEVEDYQISASTLPVTIARVESSRSGGAIDLRFTTATETANAGFRVWGTSGQGKRRLLASLASQATDSFSPKSYEMTLTGAGLGAVTAIEIEDISVFDKHRFHGPFAIGATFGGEPEADSIDWAAAKRDASVVTELDLVRASEGDAAAEASVAELRGPAPMATNGLLLARNEGIHRVTYEQLLGAGIDLTGVPAARLAIVDNGVGIPRHVEAPSGVFGLGSYIEFVARPQLTLASPVDAYLLAVDGRKAVAVSSVDLATGTTGQTAASDRYRPDQVYSFSSPNGDPWFDARALAWNGSATLSRSFDLPDLAAGSVQLKLYLWGYGDFEGTTPDHHVIVRLNGTQIAEHSFDGLTKWEPLVDVTGIATATGNTLEIFVPGDTGYAFDNVAFEGFETSYSRATQARAGRFEGTAENLRAFTIGGFSAGQEVSIWKTAGSSMTRRSIVSKNGTVEATGGAGKVYAASASAVYQPGIVAGAPTTKRSSTAQYLILTHPAFVNSLGDLVALERGRGFSTEVVTVDRIFAAYSDYASSAAALKSFLSASLAQGRLRYVLLVGADTADPYDHLGYGSVSYVPTDYRDVSQVVRFSPTDESLVDAANDGLGDVPIGRLPVRTPAELAAVVAKLYDWENSLGAEQPSALLVSGLSDGERTLAAVNQTYAAGLAGWNTVLAQVDDATPALVRQQVLDAANAGAHLVSYVGHSSMGQWDFTPLLTWQDAATLTNAGLPSLYTAWGCWNSYYVEPTIESLSARLLRQPNAGAAGAIGATTLTSEESHRALGALFFARVNAGAATVGEAFHGAKQDLAVQGGAADAIYGMTLLGDPAMSLPQF